MALENLVGNNIYITNLVPSNPAGTDPVSEGDDHVRGTKNALLNSFPNINGAVTATPEQLNRIPTLAPLDSPAFIGNPTAPTPAPNDSDTSIATTAFVQAAIDAAVGDGSLVSNGWIQLGELILQWGTYTGSVPSNGSTPVITLVKPMTTPLVTVVGEESSNINGNTGWTSITTATTVRLYNTTPNSRSGVTYLIVGK